MKNQETTIIALAERTDLLKLALSDQDDLIFDATQLTITATFVSAYGDLLTQLQTAKRSIVLVVDLNDLSLFPESYTVVPTLGEAQDLIEMERIERDLGF